MGKNKLRQYKRLKARNAEIHLSSVTSADILNDKIITVDSGDFYTEQLIFSLPFRIS